MTGTGKTTKTIGLTSSNSINGVLSGYAWAGGSITYAFPTSWSTYGGSDYSGDNEHLNGFGAFSASQKAAARYMLDNAFGSSANNGFSVEGFTNLRIGVGSNSSANLRFAMSNDPEAAWAYYPSESEEGGDLWFGYEYNDDTPVAGNYEWTTILHEIGHALGLKHGHENEGKFKSLPFHVDSMEYSIMTYRAYIGAPVSGGYGNEEYGYAQTYMMLDIAALQRMYGADFSTNSGKTVYKWKPGSGDTYVNGKVGIDAASGADANRIFATIWDGGGTDTYDLTAYSSGVRIDLRPGKHSVFSDAQLAFLGGGPNDGFARGNIFNALLYKGDVRSLIENAKGGSGGDLIAGNQARNTLYGNGGNDKLYGFSGSDKLSGGSGHDKLYGGTGKDKLYGNSDNDRLSGGSGNDRLDGGKGNDKLTGGSGADDFVFRKGYGRDTIVDFKNNVDDIDLRSYGFSKVGQVLSRADQVGSDVHIELSSTDVIIIEDFRLKNLDSKDFLL